MCGVNTYVQPPLQPHVPITEIIGPYCYNNRAKFELQKQSGNIINQQC
jgi:hypothetical protein